MNKKIHITTFLSLILCLNISAMRNNKFNQEIEKKYKQANASYRSIKQHLIDKDHKLIESENLIRDGKLKKTITLFISAINSDKNKNFKYLFTQSCYRLGFLYDNLGKIKSAIQYYKKICSFKKEQFIPKESLNAMYSKAQQRLVVLNKHINVLKENKKCNYCYKNFGILKKCKKCKKSNMARGVFYCSTNCQKKDWPNHKKICGRKIIVHVPISQKGNIKTVFTTQKNILQLNETLSQFDKYYDQEKYNLVIPILKKAIDLIKTINVSAIGKPNALERLLEQQLINHFFLAISYLKIKTTKEKKAVLHLKTIIDKSKYIKPTKKIKDLLSATRAFLKKIETAETTKVAVLIPSKLDKKTTQTITHTTFNGYRTNLHSNPNKIIAIPDQLDQLSNQVLGQLLKCNVCKRTKLETKLQKCSQCKNTRYCSVDCQRKDWKKHKKRCKSVKI